MAACGPRSDPQSCMNGMNTCAQPWLHDAGMPELQSSVGSSQQVVVTVVELSAMSGHCAAIPAAHMVPSSLPAPAMNEAGQLDIKVTSSG